MKTALSGLALSVALLFTVSCRSVPSETEVKSPVTYKADVEADIKPGEVLITGGWRTEPGKRAYFIALPEFDSSASEQEHIFVFGYLVEMKDEIFRETGFPELGTESTETGSFEVASLADFARFLSQFREERDGMIIATPRSMTLNGSAAKFSMQKPVPVLDSAGNSISPGLFVTFTPEVAEDNQSLKLAVEAVWIRD